MEEVAELLKVRGGEIYLNHKVTALKAENTNITEVTAENASLGEK